MPLGAFLNDYFRGLVPHQPQQLSDGDYRSILDTMFAGKPPDAVNITPPVPMGSPSDIVQQRQAAGAYNPIGGQAPLVQGPQAGAMHGLLSRLPPELGLPLLLAQMPKQQTAPDYKSFDPDKPIGYVDPQGQFHQATGVPTPAPKPPAAPTTRTIKIGNGQEKTQEWNPAANAWVDVATANDLVSPERLKQLENIAGAGRANTQVNVNTTNKPFFESLGKNIADKFSADRDAALKGAEAISAANEARALLDRGMFTGAFAEWRMNAAKAFGLNDAEVADTEAFQSAMGRQTLGLVKQLGAGSGISNADREYADRVAGGKVTLNESSLRQILDINERANRAFIKKYNTDAEQVKSNAKGIDLPIDLNVREPDAYVGPSAPPPGIDAGIWMHMTPQERALWNR